MGRRVFDFRDAWILAFYDGMQAILADSIPAPRTAISCLSYVFNLACAVCEYYDANRVSEVIVAL